MANYANLKDIINNPTQHGLPAWNNDANLIEGNTVKGYLLTIIDSLTLGYQYMGVATPSTNPGTLDQRVFYIAATPGTYANMGNLVVNNGEVAILRYDTTWSKQTTGIAPALVGYQFMGIATPSTNPGSPDQNVFYVAAQAGVYTNFLNAASNPIQLAAGEVAVLLYTTSWAKYVTGVPSAESVNSSISEINKKIEPIGGTVIDFSQYTPANGYINGQNKWTDVSSDNRQHIVIPSAGMDMIFVHGGAYLGQLYFLSAYNVSEGGDASVLAYYQIDAGKDYHISVPTGANYVCFLSKSGTQVRLPAVATYNDSISKNVAEIEKLKSLTSGSLDYVRNVATSLTGLDKYRDWEYSIGSSGSQAGYSFPVTLYTEFSVVTNSDYQLIIRLYDKDKTLLATIGEWVNSYLSSDEIYDNYPDTCFVHIRFKKANGSAFTIAQLLANAISSMSVPYVSAAWHTQDMLDLEELNKLWRENGLLTKSAGREIDLSRFTPVNGYINAGVWAGTDTDIRQHIAVPIPAGITAIAITANAQNVEVYNLLAAYNVVEGGSASALIDNQVVEVSQKVIVPVPSTAKYLYLQYKSGSNIYLASSVVIGGDFNSLVVMLEQEKADTSITKLNPEEVVLPRLMNLKRGYHDYGSSSESVRVLSLLHYSDVHADNENILRIRDFRNKYSAYINSVLDTGDFIGGQITDGLPAAVAYVPGFLRVIGNHDTMIRVGTPPNHHWELVGQKECYDVNFKDYIGGWDVVQPANAAEEGYCYYYKEYTQQNVRLICLDGEHWDATELAWFQSVLASAKSAGLHVVVAVHRPPFYINRIPGNTFDSIDWPNIPSGAAVTLSGAVDAVNDFMTETGGVSGKFICWLCGHVHQDCMGLGNTTETQNQLIISIATASVTPSTAYSEMARSNGNVTQDCFNVIGFDTYSGIIKLQRIGAQFDRHMRKRDTLCWDYINRELIYCE